MTENEGFKEKREMLSRELGRLQRECKEKNIPVMIAFEGCGASGKGVQISELIRSMDPRGFVVYASKKLTEEEIMHPFLWRYWIRLPKPGQFAIYDSSWYRKVILERMEKQADEVKMRKYYDSICGFEKQLTDSGMIIIKILLEIDSKEQKKRLKKLENSKDTRWRVADKDYDQNRDFKNYVKSCDEIIKYTDKDNAKWHRVDATDKKEASLKIFEAVIDEIKAKLSAVEEPEIVNLEEVKMPDLSRQVAPKEELTKEEYEKELKKLQKKIKKLHGELYQRRIPVVLAFEGWDAAGKGGAIKRLTRSMDPRGYVVHPTAAPDGLERSYHYLWRFWKSMPKDGHISIFDRTWYGRVLVERIEGFCKEAEWKRAYGEINRMERDLADSGAIVLKFWLNIDKDEQEKRFKARMEDPEKQWKITDEDWRNREKWDEYEVAVSEMIARTSTKEAPWIVVEGNSKYYARLKVLKTVVQAIEQKMNE